MLVLTRKSNQSIMIGDDIEVSVLAIMGEKVRIGIQAPRDIPVFRKEVYIEIQEEGSDRHQGCARRGRRGPAQPRGRSGGRSWGWWPGSLRPAIRALTSSVAAAGTANG